MDIQFVRTLIDLLIFYVENVAVVDTAVVLAVLHSVAEQVTG